MLYVLKILVSAILITIITEITKINNTIGGLINALPLISLISIFWIYSETNEVTPIINFSYSTFWFVLSTLPFFLVFPYFLKNNIGFYTSVILSLIVMLISYLVTWVLLKKLNLIS